MSQAKIILREIKRIIKDREPSAKVYLYGSRARKTAGKTSDWDILILLNKEEITPSIEDSITSPLYDLEFDTGEVISPLVYTKNEWHTKYSVTSFYHNIMQEGKLL